LFNLAEILADLLVLALLLQVVMPQKASMGLSIRPQCMNSSRTTA
jgi:hypothetical protein